MIFSNFLSESSVFFERKRQMSDLLKKNERFAHLLFCHERHERFVHSRSYSMLLDLISSLETLVLLEWPTTGKEHHAVFLKS